MEKKTVHIDFTPEQYEELTKRASAVGLSMTAYVRCQAVTGKVKGYNMAAMQNHAIALGELVHAVRQVIHAPNPDRWMYEADIERIEALLIDLIAQERALHESMIRKIKR